MYVFSHMVLAELGRKAGTRSTYTKYTTYNCFNSSRCLFVIGPPRQRTVVLAPGQQISFSREMVPNAAV